MPSYILMKSSRSPATGRAALEDAYRGETCADAQVPAGKIYLDLHEASSDALKLAALNPVGWHVWSIEGIFPLLTTVSNATYAGQAIKKIQLDK